MLEFFINKVGRQFELVAGDGLIDRFATAEAAADVAIRFAQDTGTAAYRIFYP